MLQTTLLLKRLLLQREYPNYVRNWPLASTTPQIITSSSYSMDVSRTNNWTCTGFCRSKMRVKRSNPDCTITMNSGHTVNRAEFKLPPKSWTQPWRIWTDPAGAVYAPVNPRSGFLSSNVYLTGVLTRTPSTMKHFVLWCHTLFIFIRAWALEPHAGAVTPRNKSIHILYNHPFQRKGSD